MNDDLISRSALMPLFIEKANLMKDRHGVKLGEEWLLNYNDIKDVIDNAPTVPLPEFKDGYKQAIIDGKNNFSRPRGEFTIDELKKWLYQIAFNNTDNDFGEYCEEIIGRLDGFKRCVTDMRKEAENE